MIERFMYNPEFLNSQFYENGDLMIDTHLNIFGADKIAFWVTEEIKKNVPELAILLK